MTHHTEKRGTREELVAHLRGYAEHCLMKGKDDRASRAQDAAHGLEQGSFSVKVGAIIYTVTSD